MSNFIRHWGRSGVAGAALLALLFFTLGLTGAKAAPGLQERSLPEPELRQEHVFPGGSSFRYPTGWSLAERILVDTGGTITVTLHPPGEIRLSTFTDEEEVRLSRAALAYFQGEQGYRLVDLDRLNVHGVGSGTEREMLVQRYRHPSQGESAAFVIDFSDGSQALITARFAPDLSQAAVDEQLALVTRIARTFDRSAAAAPPAADPPLSPAALYDRLPDVDACDPGELTWREKQAVLDYVNEIRARHHLPPVVYDDAYDDEVAQAALIIAANNYMTHFPARSFDCYTEIGADGSAASNIAWGAPQESHSAPLLAPSTVDVRNWFIDDEVPDLGHRRWILDPFLKLIAYGRVDGPPVGFGETEMAHGAALKVIHREKAVLPADAPDFVAYPYGDYPLDLVKVGWYWSFSVLADPTDYGNNQNVDYGDVTVRVQGEDGDLPVYSVSHNNEGYGLANHLQWRVRGVQVSETYRVSIDGVVVEGEPRRYSYDVTLGEPLYTRARVPVYQVSGETAQRDRLFEVKSGEVVGIFAGPGMSWPERFQTSGEDVRAQSRHVSPYLTLFRVDGTIGDRLRVPFSATDGGEAVLQIVETADGVRDPVAALEREMGQPVHHVTGTGQIISVDGPGKFALYVPSSLLPDGLERVRWVHDRGLEMTGRVRSSTTLALALAQAVAGTQAEITLAPGLTVTVRVVGDPVDGLRQQLGVPVFPVAGTDETVTVAAGTRFALYLRREAGSLDRVRWTYDQGMELDGEVFNSQTLLVAIRRADHGMDATFDLGEGRTVTVKIGGGSDNKE